VLSTVLVDEGTAGMTKSGWTARRWQTPGRAETLVLPEENQELLCPRNLQQWYSPAELHVDERKLVTGREEGSNSCCTAGTPPKTVDQ
jgi:hypothetical protein